jgi:hypothetical protein
MVVLSVLAGILVGALVGGLLGIIINLRVELISVLWGNLVFGFLGFLLGLNNMLRTNSPNIQPVETVRWIWTKAKENWKCRLLIGCLLGGLIGLVVIGLDGLIGFYFGMPRGMSEILDHALSYGFYGGMAGGIVNVLSGALVVSDITTRVLPNEGIWRSLRNAFLIGLFSWLAVGIVYVLVGLMRGLANNENNTQGDILEILVFSLYGGVIAGSVVGLVTGLQTGGFACFRHFTLRLLLWLNSLTPWRYVRFLDFAAERVFLRKVGGGYIFIHRMLLEYFATLHSGR